MPSPSSTPTKPTRIERIWERPRALLAYPLQAGALSTIALFSALRVFEALPLGAIGFVLHIVLTATFYRYAIEVLLNTAEGKLDAPEFAIGVDNSLAIDQMKLQVLLYLIAVLGQAGWGGNAGVWLFPLAVALITPAATLSLAIDRYFLQALNPWVWFKVMLAFGGAYFLVAGLLFVASELRLWIAGWTSFLPVFLSLPLVWMVNNYLTVLGFHMMGYLVYQDHERIGYQQRPDPVLPPLRHREDPDQALIDQARALAAGGQSAAAIALLRAQIDQRGATPVLHDSYRSLLTAADDQQELARHGQQYLLVLMAQTLFPRAVQLLIECQARDPGHCPPVADDIARLAEEASKRGQHQAAIRLLENAVKQFPRKPEGPGWALLCARLLAEKLGRIEDASRLLHDTRERYPEHPERAAMDRYLAYLLGLEARG
ncbi:MAG: tol-pal system YbgF family protein [Lysobacterales bacterium]